MDGTAPDGHGESIDADTSQLFKAFRAYSSRKGVQAKEVVIVDNDVSKALLDYIDDNIITNIVLGASTRNALQKKSRSHDVPTIINKSAPGFCSVYVISETEIQSVRPAVVPAANFSSLPDAPYHQTIPSHFPTEHAEPEEEVREMVIREKRRSIRSERRRPKNRSANLSIDTTDTLFRGKKNLSSYHSLGNHRDFLEQLIFESIDDAAQNVDFTTSSESDKEVQSSPLKDIEV